MLAKDILTGFVVPQAIVIILAAALVMFGIRRGLAPLNQLRAEIAMRKEKSELTIETKEMPIEVQPVLEEINRLIGRLQAVYDAHKRFTADAAHQLRTPLAGLSAQTDLARAQDNPEATQHALDQIKHASSRLNHAVSQLLSLARNETGSARLLRLEKISLCGLAKEVTMDWVEVAMDRRIDLGFNGSNAPVEVLGDVERIKELLNNLLDNAVRFCPAGSHVTVSVDVDRTLSVEDDGPGIPVAERERIFERFYRVLDNDAEGSGLGLAIVKEIAEMHHCTISLGAGKEGRGALFSVRFPDSAEVSLL